jgi:hypothetical protein
MQVAEQDLLFRGRSRRVEGRLSQRLPLLRRLPK